MPGFPAAQDTQAAFATVLVDEWVRAGVAHAVVSPGSRSSPMLVALAEASEHELLQLHVVLDERSAGFFALGLALRSGVPAVVVTTSGTAAAELHPAVVEADQAGAPLLAVTADRPAELHDCGAPQTVSQVGLYGSAVRWAVSPGVPELASASWWRSLACRAVAEARGGARRPGPVHLNLAFREPLLGSAEAFFSAAAAADGHDGAELASVRDGRPGRSPWHSVAQPAPLPPPPGAVELLATLGERGLIVAGRGAGDPDAVWELSRATSWPVLAEPASGCRRLGSVAAADALLRTELVRGWHPDVVLRLGATWSSRTLNEWLAGLGCRQVLVDRWGTWSAPDRQPDDVVVASPELLCREVAKAAPGASQGAWAAQWALAEGVAQSAIDECLGAEEAVSEPALARALVGSMPHGTTLFVSSSMPVRDVEWWTRPRDDVRVLANRGANGIDGVVSTALGVSASVPPAGEADEKVVALVGDLAFLYDAGCIVGAAAGGMELDVVVVDNDGGGIFNFLPQASGQPPERFERLWGTPHGADICGVARGYGAPATRLSKLEDLVQAVSEPRQGPGARVFVVGTDRAGNVEAHRRLHAAVGAAVSGLAKRQR